MTMGDESLYASMALPVVIMPILKSLEQKDMTAAEALRSAFTKVEAHYPGFSYKMIQGILQRAEVQNRIDMTECLLRLEGMNDNDNSDLRAARTEEPFRELNLRSSNLKKILSRIPDEIYDRRKFLETIKEIASAIKNLLDAVNCIFIHIEDPSQKQNLEQRKREFVKYSKRFSNTLKDFFRDSPKNDVFLSANYLINQTNLIMKTVKEAT